MKKLMIILSLVFVASCGKDDLSSCGDNYVAGSCVESSNEGDVKTQKDDLETDEKQCTTTEGEGDDEKDVTCVQTAASTATTPVTPALEACSGSFDFAAANGASPSKCAEADETDDVNALTVGDGEAKCTHTDSGTDYICVE